MITLSLIVLILLGLVAIIDFLFKKIPSIFLTAIIFVVAMVNMFEINFGIIHLSFGILAFIFAYLLYESNFFSGIADIKVIVIVGMMIKTIPMFFIFIILIMSFGLIYKIVWKLRYKGKKEEEIPFIPSMFITYLIMFLIGGII